MPYMRNENAEMRNKHSQRLLPFFILFATLLSMNIALPIGASAAENLPLHYLEKNSGRYGAYQKMNPEMPFDLLVAYVNANVDKAYYEDVETIENPSQIRAFVSKHYALPSYYAPNDIVVFPGGGELRAEAAAAFIKMRDAAGETGLHLAIRSSYRSHGSQVASYDLVADNYGIAGAEISVARPGHSEHQLGLALDIMHREGTVGPLTGQGFGETQEFFWLLEHGYEYGFILRYPENYVHIQGFTYEPWHWRYVGVGTATIMHDKGIETFEEYYGRYLAPDVREKLMRNRIPEPALLLPAAPRRASAY